MPGADVALQVRGRQVRILPAAWTDVLAFRYGVRRDSLDADRADLRRGSGAWRPPQLILNRPYTVRRHRRAPPRRACRTSPRYAGATSAGTAG